MSNWNLVWLQPRNPSALYGSLSTPRSASGETVKSTDAPLSKVRTFCKVVTVSWMYMYTLKIYRLKTKRQDTCHPHEVIPIVLLSTPVLMHGGLICIAFCPSVCLSVCLSVCDWTKIHMKLIHISQTVWHRVTKFGVEMNIIGYVTLAKPAL